MRTFRINFDASVDIKAKDAYEAIKKFHKKKLPSYLDIGNIDPDDCEEVFED